MNNMRLTLAILALGPITHVLAQNTTSPAIKSAPSQVVTQLSDGQIEVTYSTPQFATTFTKSSQVQKFSTATAAKLSVPSSSRISTTTHEPAPISTSPQFSTTFTTSSQVQKFSTATAAKLSVPSSSGASTTTYEPALKSTFTSTSVLWESAISTTQQFTACATGGTCSTYNCIACSNGDCFCGLDADNTPTCFQDEYCGTTCSTNKDCSAGKRCLVNSCCGSSGYCISFAQDPSWCTNGDAGNKRDHGGIGWEVSWRGSTSCRSFHQILV